MEVLKFDVLTNCDWCGQKEICAITHFGTTNYNRLVCLECALSINGNQKCICGNIAFDLNNSIINFNCLKEQKEEN
ncbi:hypothetical protein IKN40_04495 [bacterium]|nr:hypothetical protein [bacterium]